MVTMVTCCLETSGKYNFHDGVRLPSDRNVVFKSLLSRPKTNYHGPP